MKKRLMSLLLCAIMVLPIALTGCSDKAGSGDETTSSTTSSSSKAMTITLYTITESSTTDEALAQVEEAINVITESDFNTHVILRTATEKQYEKMIDDAIEAKEEEIRIAEEEAAAKKAAEKAAREAAKKAAKENGGKAVTTAAETTAETTIAEDETVLNEYGLEETVYPEEDGTQLDIFLINSFDMFTKYQSAGYLAQLDEQLSIGSKILKQYIRPNFLSAAKVGGKTYAIPNNHTFGEYEYLLINKKVFDGLYYDIDNVKTFNDLEEYFYDILKYEKGVTPLLGEYDGNVYYFDKDNSIYGSVIPTDLSTPTAAPPTNLITDPSFMAYFQIMKTLREANGISKDGKIGDGKTYGAVVMKGDYNTPAEYEEDYYVLTLKAPTATNENVYTGMYAVSKFAKDVARCMDIITYLSTNKDFINLFTYGIEDVHYTKDEVTDVITKIGKDYAMNMAYTGNQFMMYQSTDMSAEMKALSDDNWALAKLQNLDMVKHPYLGFVLQEQKVDPEDKEKKKMVDIMIEDLASGEKYSIRDALNQVHEMSPKILKDLEEFKPYTEIQELKRRVRNEEGQIVQITEEVEVEITFIDFLNNLRIELAENKPLLALTFSEATETPFAQYNKWFSTANK